jgi:signal transduction histidine kinase
MHNILKQLERRVNTTVDWFIPAELKHASDLMQGARMFLFSHLFGPFLGHTISLSMLYIKGEADFSWWIFFLAVTAFWPFPIILQRTGKYVPLALLSIENLMFCIFWGCYNYGGVSSPILPWLITVPLLGFFYLTGRTERVIVGCMIVANLAVFYAIFLVVGFPETVPTDGLVALGLVSTFCASVYVSMMALYHGNVVSSQVELEKEVQRHLETEQMLRRATRQVERATLAKTDFLAKMSHELRNPLNSIIGYSEMLIEEISVPDCQKAKDLNAIKEAGYTLLQLINDLLDLSKLEAGKMDVHEEFIDLTSLIDDVGRDWEAAVVENGNKLVIDRPVQLTLKSDLMKLRRVLDNLLSNAAKFTSNGSVNLIARLLDGQIIISVQDSGVGILEDNLQSLFETFRSSEQETSSNYGDQARLGLPLAYRYCRLMGGDLTVESWPGRGSRFVIRLPNSMALEKENSAASEHVETMAA